MSSQKMAQCFFSTHEIITNPQSILQNWENSNHSCFIVANSYIADTFLISASLKTDAKKIPYSSHFSDIASKISKN